MNNQEIEDLTYQLMHILALLKILSSMEEDVEAVYISIICREYYEKLNTIINDLEKRIK